ncbi:MAG: hypothetical protein ACLR23_06015 [Clostridia bacterium]
MQKEADLPPPAARRPCRRGNRMKNARRRGEERQGPACTREVPRGHRRNEQAGGKQNEKCTPAR